MGYFTGKSFFAEIYGFQVRFSLPGSDNVSRRYSCSGTIGAPASVVLLFLNARPVVSDERSEEFRRSVKESLNGPVQANRSDSTKPGIGIERKNIPAIKLKKGRIEGYSSFLPFSDYRTF